MNKLENVIKKIQKDTHFLEILKGSGIAFGLKILGMIFGYIFTLLVTRNLGAKAWGIFALSMVVLQITAIISKIGIDTALLRFTAESVSKGDFLFLKNMYKKALRFVIPVSLLLSILLYIVSPLLAEKGFSKPYLVKYFHFVSFFIIPFVLLFIHREVIRGLKKIKEYMLLNQIGISFFAIIFFLIGLIFFKQDLLPLASYGCSLILIALFSILLLKRYFIAWRVEINVSSDKSFKRLNYITYKELLSVSLPMFFSSTLAMIMGWTDTFMIGVFRTVSEVGVYNVAMKLSMVTSIFLVAINTIAAPKFAEFWGKKDIKGLSKVAKQSTKFIFWTTFPILLFLMLFSKDVLEIFGNGFRMGSTALIILTIGQFFNAASGSVGELLKMTDKQTLFFYTTIVATGINILLNLMFIPTLGLIGAALSTCVSVILWNLFCILIVKIKYDFLIFYFPFLWRIKK